jgi:hypothetical protein
MEENIQCLCGNTTANKDLRDCYGGTCLNCDYFFSRNKMKMLEDKTCCVCGDDELQGNKISEL